MNETHLPAVIVGPRNARYSIIWLHGLGADGHDFEPIVPELQFQARAQTRFVFPHAPMRPVTVNNGYVMRAWYDIVAINARAKEDEQGIRASARQVDALIEQERQQGVPARHIVLAGFSQGGAIVLHTALRHTQTLAGVMALSTYLPLSQTLSLEATSANQTLPIFMAHGTDDPVIPLQLALDSREALVQARYAVDWHTYPMAHSVIPQEIDDISAWLDSVFS